ncbi:MAG TPA: PAS domain-containing protein [Bryobacteraceae bacterium]|nr:PAS domain-containing protein [Bryobacteraceae bacterium]
MSTRTMLTRDEYVVVVDHAPLLIWRADASGACDYFNERWLQYRGRSLDQEQGDGWVEGVHPDDRPACVSAWRSHFRARTAFEMDFRLQRHDGEYGWVHDSGGPVCDGGGHFAGFVGSCIEFNLVARSSSEAPRDFRNLRGLLSLCSWCYRVEDEGGAWMQIERYVTEHSSIGFTHGICPNCLARAAAEP